MDDLFQRIFDFVATERMTLIWPAVIFLAVFAGGLAVRRVLFARLHRWAKRTEWTLDDLIIESLHTPVLLWITILAVYLATEYSRLPRGVTAWSGKILVALAIVSVTIAAAKLAKRIVRVYGGRMEGALPVGTLTQMLASLSIGLIGTLVLLNTLGVSITPLLTALGVGGLAVALALQDTLSNFFAGFYVSLARQIRVGDFIQLDSGQKGYVADIGWRSTTLRERLNNLVVIPNNRLAQSIVTNYHLPAPWLVFTIQVGVSYDADPEQVERVLQDEMERAAKEAPGFVPEPLPCVRLSGFGESSIDFTLVGYVADYDAQFLAQHELRKRILARFKREGIKIPYPVRTVELTQARPTAAGT